MDVEESLFSYDNPYSYLSSEYLRLNSKKYDWESIDIDDCLESVKELYGPNQKKLFESDKILYKKLKQMQLNLDLPIDEQDRSTFFLLDRHFKNVVQICKENNICISGNIVLGTLPINDLDGFTCDFDNGEKLIVLNQGLFQFLYLMGRVVSSVFSMKDSECSENKMVFDFNTKAINDNLESNMEYSRNFLEALVLYFVYKNLNLSKIYFQEDKKINFSVCLWDNAQLFVVAHEYSHIILNNMLKKENVSKNFLETEPKLYKLLKNWHKELKADQIALQIVMAHNIKENFGLLGSYLSSEFLFACLNIIEEINNIKFSETHPSSKIRVKNLRKFLKKQLLPEKADNFISASKQISYAIARLWDINKSSFYKIFRHT